MASKASSGREELQDSDKDGKVIANPEDNDDIWKDVLGSDIDNEVGEVSPLPDKQSSQRSCSPAKSQFPRNSPVMPDSDSEEEIIPVRRTSRGAIVLPDSGSEEESSSGGQKSSRNHGGAHKITNKESSVRGKTNGKGHGKEVGLPKTNRAKQRMKEQNSQQDKDEQSETEGPTLKKAKTKTAFAQAIEETRARRRPTSKTIDYAKIEEECIDFLTQMVEARNADLEAYTSGKPAMNKLSLLREVEKISMKVDHKEALLQNNFLAIIKTWLEPYPDGMAPNVQIRQSLLNILTSIPVNEDLKYKLQNSRKLGHIIHYMSIMDTNAPTKRAAEKLLQHWYRLITDQIDRFDIFSGDADISGKDRALRGSDFTEERKEAMIAIRERQMKQERLLSSRTTNRQTATAPRGGRLLYGEVPEDQVEPGRDRVRKKRKRFQKKENEEAERGIDNRLKRLRQSNKMHSKRTSRFP